MIAQINKLYELMSQNETSFVNRGLKSNFYIDTFRGQINDPELFELYTLPAIFVEYSIKGQGKKNPREVTMILHIAQDNLVDTSNISESLDQGLNIIATCLTIQEILEDSKLGQTSRLQFIGESQIDAEALNYHVQTYSFTAYLQDMFDDYPAIETGNIEEIVLNSV